MAPKRERDNNDDDSDYEPAKSVSPPPGSRRQPIRACRKVGRPRKNPEQEVVIPEELDPNKFQAEVIDQNLGFAAVGGLEETIELLKRKVIFPIENQKTMKKKFAYNPMKGVIFHGLPGTGKTLLAKAMAAELSRLGKNEFKFYYRKGPDLLSKYVGESENSVKLIFDLAKANKPAIIFFDEIDALCSKRNEQSGNQHEATLVCTILAQMDLIKGGEVLVIGATNRLESLDPAFRRQGRFDTEIFFSNPTHKGRRDILKIHFGRWEKASQPNEKLLEELATRTASFTGADLEGLCQDALDCALVRKGCTGKAAQKQLNDTKILPTDWYTALLRRRPTPTNIFGNQNFGGIQLDPSLEPLIGGIKNEIKEWIQGRWSPGSTGFTFAVIWSKSEDFVKDMDNILVPAALSTLTDKDMKMIVMTKDKLELTEMTKILDQATGDSSSSTLIYFPRVDIMDENLKKVFVESLEQQPILRFKRATLFVIGSAACGINKLDTSLTELLDIPARTFEVRRPSEKEVKTYFTPTLKVNSKHRQRSMSQILKASKNLNVTKIFKMKEAMSQPGANIENISRDFCRLFGQNAANESVDSGNEEGSENDENSEDDGSESDSGHEE